MLITLTTDFGTRDPYVGIMKGVIASIAPDARVIDITHEIEPQNIMRAGLVIASLLDYFPATTIHVAVVDPTVGSRRAPIAIQTDRTILIGPDNGLFTAALQCEPRRAAVTLTNPAYHLHPTSRTFHGRDIFAPAAAHLARGVPLHELGDPIKQLVTLDLPQPQLHADHIEALVIDIDRFGNLITNLTQRDFDTWRRNTPIALSLTINNEMIHGIHATYADVSEGKLLAYFGSTSHLEIAVRNGSAAARLGATTGTPVTINRT
mgnify:CR=1 FL=1